MIDGDIEEPLDLRRVQIEREHAVEARFDDEVRDQLRGDRRASGFLAVLTRVAEVRHDGRDPAGGRAAQAVREDQQLHDVFVDRVAGGKHHEAVSASDVFFRANDDLAVGEDIGAGLAEGHVEVLADLLGQRDLVAPRENLHSERVVPRHISGPPNRRSRADHA